MNSKQKSGVVLSMLTIISFKPI